MSFAIGCTTRPFAKWPFSQACHFIAEAGYTDVAIFFDVGINPGTSREHTLFVRKTALGAGLSPSMLIARAELEAGVEEAVRRYQRMIDHASLLGAQWLLDLGTGDAEHYRSYFELMRAVSPYALERGVGISLKPHGGLTLTADNVISAAREVDHPAFGISYDPGNIIYYTCGEERPETDVAQVAPYVTTAIIKDCVVRDGKPDVLITPGEGWVNFDAVLSGLIAGGFDGPLYVECVGGTELGEIARNVRLTREFVEEVLASILHPAS